MDQRRCDALVGILHSSGAETSKKGNPFLVVAHVPLAALADDPGGTIDLAGELEQQGLIDAETVQRIACDATIAIAVDDDVGHTMYEGRARRFPTGAQRREVGGGIDGAGSRAVPTSPSPTSTTSLGGNPVAAPTSTIWPFSASSPSSGALEGLDHVGQRQRGTHVRRPHRPGHDLAPLAAVDQGHGSTPVGSVGLRRRVESGRVLIRANLENREAVVDT